MNAKKLKKGIGHSRGRKRESINFWTPAFARVTAVVGSLLFSSVCWADQDTSLMKASTMDAGKMNAQERKLYQESIRASKQTIARETLEVFYRDAVEYYRENRYDEALEILDKIYSIDPYYEDVRTLRDTLLRLKQNREFKNKRDILEDYMKKGNEALQMGQNAQAIAFWKQALSVDPTYEPAKQKIQEVNHALAQKQFEEGWLQYHHGDMEEALDSWSNAIALDPSFKKRGLLLLMSKVDLSLRQERATRLATQGFEQYEHKDFPGSLQTYEELLRLEPRHEEARRMAGKIKIQLGQAAFKAGRDALSNGLYAKAIKEWELSIRYGFEVQRSQQAMREAEDLLKKSREPKPEPKEEPAVAASTAPVAAAVPPSGPPPPPQAVDPKEAMTHYRQGLSAFRAKDFHRAVDELEIARQLDPTDEHIYIALERARNEWKEARGQPAPSAP